MWSMFGKTDLFLITTNPTRKKDGSIVMGRGIAKQMKDRYPQFPYDFAKALDELHPEIDQHNVGTVGYYDDQLVGFFMVKDHWAETAKLSIIELSVFYLNHGFRWKGDMRVDLNFPGIGNGGLNREDVLPLIEKLSDNVHVWEY